MNQFKSSIQYPMLRWAILNSCANQFLFLMQISFIKGYNTNSCTKDSISLFSSISSSSPESRGASVAYLQTKSPPMFQICVATKFLQHQIHCSSYFINFWKLLNQNDSYLFQILLLTNHKPLDFQFNITTISSSKGWVGISAA